MSSTFNSFSKKSKYINFDHENKENIDPLTGLHSNLRPMVNSCVSSKKRTALKDITPVRVSLSTKKIRPTSALGASLKNNNNSVYVITNISPTINHQSTPKPISFPIFANSLPNNPTTTTSTKSSKSSTSLSSIRSIR